MTNKGISTKIAYTRIAVTKEIQNKVNALRYEFQAEAKKTITNNDVLTKLINFFEIKRKKKKILVSQ